MKNKLKNLSLLLFILFSILIVSCEAESYVVEKKPDSVNLQDLKFRVVPFDQVGSKFNQISQELELNKHIIGLVKNNGMQQREAAVNDGIEIVDGLVKELTYDEYTSYTMLIKSEEATNKFYNLVIEKIGQLTKLAVVKYEPTEEWMLTKGEFKGEITTFRINDLQTTIGRLDELILGNGSSGGNTTYPTDCNGYVVSTTVVTETLCGCNDHSWQQLVNGTCTCDDTPSLQTTTYYECIEFGTPNGPGTGNSSSPGGYVTGYPIGSTPTNSQNNAPTLTMPFSKDEIVKTFYYSLNQQQQQWWKDENNSNSRAEIEAYIVNQPNVELAFGFAEELIDFTNENGGSFKFDDAITNQNSLGFDNLSEFQNYYNDNFENNEVYDFTIEENNSNTKTARFSFDLGAFAYLNVQVKQKLQTQNQSYSIENVSSSISGATLAMEWSQNNDDDLQISGNVATITFTGTLSLNCFINGLGTFFSDNVTVICKFNIITGALISGQLVGLD